jgi:integrase
MPRTSSTITKRADGRYEARGTFNGKRRSFFGSTAEEARRRLTAALAQRDAGQTPPPDHDSVAVYLRTWLAAQRSSLRPRTLESYEAAVEVHLIPLVGKIRLTRLTPTQVSACYAALRAKGLSGTSVQIFHGVLRKALQDALRRGEIVRNVADLVDTPKRDTPEMSVLTPEECRGLLEVARGDKLEAFFVLALTTGARLGELQALTWRAVDFDRRRIQIWQTYQENKNGKPVFSPPKTARSRRTIVLTAIAIEALRRHRAAQLEHRVRVGSLYQDHGLVFAGAFGMPISANAIRIHAFAPLCARAGLPHLRFHALRHSAATLLMSSGVPVKVASEMLGHSDITTTLRVYSHVMEPDQERAASAMDRTFGTP